VNSLKTGRVGIANRVKGFTLIEMMITVLILGVLSAIAYASYQNAVTNSRRAAAASCLQQRAQFVERFYTTNLTYAGAPAPAACDADVARFYSVSFVAAPTANAFTLQAVPSAAQLARDGKCATLRLDQQGQRTVTGTASPDDCW